MRTHFHKGSHRERVSSATFCHFMSMKFHQKRLSAEVTVLNWFFSCIFKQAIESELHQVLPSTLVLHKPFQLCLRLGCLLPTLCEILSHSYEASSATPYLPYPTVCKSLLWLQIAFPPPSRGFAHSFLNKTVPSQNQTDVHYSWKGQPEIRTQQLPWPPGFSGSLGGWGKVPLTGCNSLVSFKISTGTQILCLWCKGKHNWWKIWKTPEQQKSFHTRCALH